MHNGALKCSDHAQIRCHVRILLEFKIQSVISQIGKNWNKYWFTILKEFESLSVQGSYCYGNGFFSLKDVK